jgi:hypothetical protein
VLLPDSKGDWKGPKRTSWCLTGPEEDVKVIEDVVLVGDRVLKYRVPCSG